MEHIRQFDWCYNERESQHFLTEEAIDNSCIERILSNKFYDPLISSDEDEQPHNIDWGHVFTRPETNMPINPHLYIPGLRPVPPYPHLSTLSISQQTQLLKVINSHYPGVLEAVYIPRPTKLDRKLYEDLQEKYLKEQKEYITWAKSQWTSGQNIRALRPKPHIENVYEAEFKMKMVEHQSLPKQYELAAQITLKSEGSFEIVPQKDLIKVSNTEIPQHNPISNLFERKVSLNRPITTPAPCQKHPCRFVLPGETSVSILPLIEVQRELAQYAADNGASFCVSESALRRLVDGSAWNISVCVCRVNGPDGEPCNVVVMGSDFSILREHSQIRTYKAIKHLLRNVLVPQEEKMRIMSSWRKPTEVTKPQHTKVEEANDEGSDDEDDHLVIDIELERKPYKEDIEIDTENEKEMESETETKDIAGNESEKDRSKESEPMLPQLFTCTCEDTVYERPPPRSFRKWEVRSKNGYEHFNAIVHCSHKLRGKSSEVIVEPIVEYQVELGGCELPEPASRSLALACHLRKNSSVLVVRVDGPTGDLVTSDSLSQEDLARRYPEHLAEASNTVYTAFRHLKDLLPGNYVLRHETEHGDNALLYVARSSVKSESLLLNFDITANLDDAKCLIAAPTLAPVLLPFHKHRQILPCAFTPYYSQLHAEARKPPARTKLPPQAIKWPKKKKKGKKRQAQ